MRLLGEPWRRALTRQVGSDGKSWIPGNCQLGKANPGKSRQVNTQGREIPDPKLLAAGLSKSKQVYASRRRQEILVSRVLAAGLSNSKQV